MDQNQTLPVEKDQVVSSLYALRAGLSVIAENTSEIKRMEAAAIAREQETANLRVKIREANIGDEKKAISDCQNSNMKYLEEQKKELVTNNQNLIEEKKRGIHRCKKDIVKYSWKLILMAFLYIILAFWIVVSIGAFVSKIFTIFPIIFAIIHIFIMVKIYKSDWEIGIFQNIANIKESKTEIRESRSEIPRLKNNIFYEIEKLEKEVQQDIKEETANLKALKKEHEELLLALSEHEEKKEKENKKDATKIAAIAEESQAIYKKLAATYASTIMEDDWKNIDLLIFYLQSGRAESCKEALQLVDRQRQTDQITKAIADASTTISNSIRNYTQILGNLIVQSSANMESQIRNIGREINGWQMETAKQMSALGESLDMQIGQNRQLLAQGEEALSATRLQNALLEKANESSEQLMYELRYNQRSWNK